MNTPPVIDTTPRPRTNTFPRQLRFWGIHCGLTSLPSFWIAITHFNNPLAVIAMLCGVATFIFGYAFITSTPFYGKVHEGLIGRSIKLGTRIRMIISLASLPLLIPIIGHSMDQSGPPSESLLFVPDFWFGWGAIAIVSLLLQFVMPSGGVGRWDSLSENFLVPYLTTVVEGLLISVSLILIAFITLIILNVRRNKQQMPAYNIPSGPPPA